MSARDDLLAVPDEVLRSGKIAQALLVHMDFRDNPKRWWTGFGYLSALGYSWQGVGDFVGIGEISSSYSLSAEQVVFTVAATPELLRLALTAKDTVRGRAVTVRIAGIMQESVSVGGWSRAAGDVAYAFSLFTGTMQRMPWGGEGSTTRQIQVECEGIWVKRNAPPRGRWTEADQQARYHGDKGFERLPLYRNYETGWRY